MSKSKVISTKKMSPVTGGKGHMFGKQTVGTKKPGVTGKADSGSGKFIKGGPARGSKQGKSSPSVSGKVSTSKG